MYTLNGYKANIIDEQQYDEVECGFYTCEEDFEEGIEPFEYEWPMFDLGAGHSYGLVDV